MKDRLHRIVRDRVRQLVETAANTGTVAQEELESVRRLATLADLASAEGVGRRRQWPILAAALLTVALVSVLIFSHVRETEVELDARVSEISFAVPSHQAILGTQVVPAFAAKGLGRVVVPDEATQADQTLKSGGGELCDLALEADQQSGGGSISIPSLSVPPGTRVSVTSPGANQVELTLVSPPGTQVDLEVALKGHVKLVARGPDTTVQRADHFAVPRLIELEAAAPAPLVLELTASPDAILALSAQVPVRDVSFVRVEEQVEGTNTFPRKVSSLLSGTLHLESLNGKEVALRPYEELTFRSSSGAIRKLALVPSDPAGKVSDAFQVQAHAHVRGMTVGAEDNVRSLMPTYLEWLAARQSLALFWGSTLYLTGLLASILRWLKISQ